MKKIYNIFLLFLFFLLFFQVISFADYSVDETSSYYYSELTEALELNTSYKISDFNRFVVFDLGYCKNYYYFAKNGSGFFYRGAYYANTLNANYCLKVVWNYSSNSYTFEDRLKNGIYYSSSGEIWKNVVFSNFNLYLCSSGVPSHYNFYTEEMCRTYNHELVIDAGIDVFANDDFVYIPDIVPTIPKEHSLLYIQDMNLKKQFKFEFDIPMIREDTKYYTFLQDYKRVDYNTISANFIVYTVTTPEGYDFSNYENYLYYDDLEKLLYLPAGTEVHYYQFSGYNGENRLIGTEIDNLEPEIENYIALRNRYVSDGTLGFETHTFDFSNSFSSNFIYHDNNLDKIFVEDYLSYLVPTNRTLYEFSMRNVALSIYQTIKEPVGLDKALSVILNSVFKLDNFSEAQYKFALQSIYYAKKPLAFKYKNFCFGNYSIVSYKNEKIDNSFTRPYYDFYKKVKVYNQENKFQDNVYYIGYIDNQISFDKNFFPDGYDTNYLDSYLFSENENNNIFYDISDITSGDNVVNYNNSESPLRDTPKETIFNNIVENNGDNIVINNYYNEVVDNTSSENWFNLIYKVLIEIRDYIKNLGQKISVNFFDFGDKISNTTNYLLKPNDLMIESKKEEVAKVAEEHLGLIYEPYRAVKYILSAISGIVASNEDICLDIPEIQWNDVVIIPHINFNFTSFMRNDIPVLQTIHLLYLDFVDFSLVWLVYGMAKRKWEEMTNK